MATFFLMPAAWIWAVLGATIVIVAMKTLKRFKNWVVRSLLPPRYLKEVGARRRRVSGSRK